MTALSIHIVEHGQAAPFEHLNIGIHQLREGTITHAFIIQGGMQSGAPSVAFVAIAFVGKSDLAEEWLFAEMSADMLESLAGAVRGARAKWASQ